MTRLALLRLADVVLEREYARDVAARHLAELERELAAARDELAAAARADQPVVPRPVTLDVRVRRTL